MYSKESNYTDKGSKTILPEKWSKTLAVLIIQGEKASGIIGYLCFNIWGTATTRKKQEELQVFSIKPVVKLEAVSRRDYTEEEFNS